MSTGNLRVNGARLLDRLHRLGEVGALAGGGVCRLAFSEEDRQGRDLVKGWMEALGLSVTVDAIGNVVGIRQGTEDGPPVMMGSHIDSVRAGGIYDGCLGVLGGLEVIETLVDHDIQTRHPVAVAFFSNEEGARFAPDMMGSAVHQGALSLEDALANTDADDIAAGDALAAIGYAGPEPVGAMTPRAYLELHVEQGPVLEETGLAIGAVAGVQGISWTEYTIFGTANHAGTTPIRLRHDAGLVMAEAMVEARRLASEMGGDQVATIGHARLHPDLVNVIPSRALFTLDLRNTDDDLLVAAEKHMDRFIHDRAAAQGARVESRSLARFAPVAFDPAMVDRVAATAAALCHSVMKMPSGAGHDAQMFAPNCPTGMIFVPSRKGISHNPAEHTDADQIQAGADVLLRVALDLAEPAGG